MSKVLTALLSRLRVRLLLLILFAVLPALGLILYSAMEDRQRAAEDVRQDASQLAQLAVLQQEEQIEGARQVLVLISSLSRGSDLATLRPDSCRQAFAGLLSSLPLYANFGLVLPSGDIVCSAVPTAGIVNAADRTWFQNAIQNGGLAFGEYQVGRITGERTLNIGYPILNEQGALKGVAFVAMRLSSLNELLAQIQLPDGSAITMLDRSGTVLARSPDPDAWVGSSIIGTDLGEAINSVPSGVVERTGLDGANRLYAFESLSSGKGQEIYTAVGIPEAVAYGAVEAQLERNLLALGAVALVAMAAAWFGGDAFVLRRMRAIVIATENLRAGDLKARTGQPHDGTEFGRLASSFDAMASALERREEERDLAQSELKQTAIELTRKNEELESFTYSVSHDLKEPLRSLEAFSQFLLEDYAEHLDDQGRDYLERLVKGSVHMKQLIDDLLTLSRLARQPETVKRVSMSTLVEDIIGSMEVMIREKNARVEVEGDLPDVLGDSARVEQIFANLIANGLKFNDQEQPLVQVRAESNGDGVVKFAVEDNGIGIDPAYHDRIFGVFQRLHAREQYEGTGAGLAIVRRAASVSGGDVWLESELGAGAKFYVTLPEWNEQNVGGFRAA